jgi:hypothetical protein
VRPQGVQLPAHPSVVLTASVSWSVEVVERSCNVRIAASFRHCITQIDDFELVHDEPLASEFPKRERDGSRNSAAGSALREGAIRSGREAIVAPGCPSTSAILMFYRANFPLELRQVARISR